MSGTDAAYAERVKRWLSGDETVAKTHVCFCLGPQDGAPLCPCRMKHLRIIDGRFVEVIDHGPAPKITPDATAFFIASTGTDP